MILLLHYAHSFLGTPYKWGGNNVLEGFDCSGMVMELLKSAAEPLPQADMNAQALYDHFSRQGKWNSFTAGALAFYGESATKVTHVAFLIDQYRVIEAGGGGHLVLTKEDAARQGSVVRMRPIKYRKDLVAVIKPAYSGIGQI